MTQGDVRKSLLIIVDQYDWAWDISSRELLKYLPTHKGTIVSLKDFVEKNINPSEFDLVIVWYWIERRLEDRKMIGDHRVIDKLNCPEKTILCIAGEHVFEEGFDIAVVKNFKYFAANNKKIYGILKRLIPDKELTIFSHGVDLEKFQPRNKTSSSGQFTVGWIGHTKRLSKRYQLAVEAVSLMSGVELKVAGHVLDKEIFISPKEMPAFYNSLDCLLVTSDTESHPLIVYEAMASGIPVITTPVGDISEFIQHDKSGLFLPLNCTVDDIKSAITRLKNNPKWAHYLSVNGRKTVEQKLDWSLISKQYTEFIDLMFLPSIYNHKFTVSMLVSRDDELFEKAVASVVRQKPDEFRAYIDKFTLKDTSKAEKVLRKANAKIFYQTYNSDNISYERHTYDVAGNVHRAILEAENKWVCWVDDDDEILLDRRLILSKYGSDKVGLIHGDVIRVYPRPMEWMIKAKVKDLVMPIATTTINKPREAKKCVGSGTIYNREAFSEVYDNIFSYMEKNITSASFWDFMIAYWIKRNDWKIVHVPAFLSIQNVNMDHPPERKKLYGQWDIIADELDTLPTTIPLKFKVNSRFLHLNYLPDIMSNTLDMYLQGKDLTNSPLVQWGRDTLKQGIWWYGCKASIKSEEEVNIQRRQESVIQLYYSIKEKGYNGSLITTYIDDEGRIQIYDGFHRLCIMKYLNINTDVNVIIRSFHTEQVNRNGDYPFRKTLKELNKGTNTYQPIDDLRVKGWTVWRKDSSKRLEFILKYMKEGSVLDIGCAEGFFTLELLKKGFDVTAIDTSPKRVAITRYLATIQELLDKGTFITTWWEDLLKKDVFFDNILFLAVFHHDILNVGVEKAFEFLKLFRSKANRIFIELPLSSQKIGWLDQDGLSHKKNLYNFTEEEFKEKVEAATGYKVTNVWKEGIRPIFVLEMIP